MDDWLDKEIDNTFFPDARLGKRLLRECPVMLPEAPGKPDWQAGASLARTSGHESAVGESVPDEGGVPAVLGVHLRGQRQEVPVVVVPDGDAYPHWADEEKGTDTTVPLRPFAQLVQGWQGVQQRHNDYLNNKGRTRIKLA